MGGRWALRFSTMASDQVRPNRPAHVSLGAEGHADALNVLRDATKWRLTSARWGVVANAVRAMAAALVSGDVRAFRDAVSDLELAGPVRATRVGDTPTVPAPEPVLEEIYELIHTVDGRTDTPK
jgi:hypothetical protein